MKFARLNEAGEVIETFGGCNDLTGAPVLPTEVFPADLAQQFVEVPDEVAAGWQRTEGGAFVAPEPPPVPPAPEPAPVSRRISRLAFLSRFTDAEAIAFDLGSIGATAQAAAMRRYMAKVNAAAYIDLDRPDTRAGVIALEGTLLAEGRALEILDAEIQPSETYRD